MPRRRFLFVLLMLITTGAPLAAGEPEEADFPSAIQQSEESWPLEGSFRYTYRLFFPLYEAALYIAPNGSPRQILDADCGFQLRFYYLRKIDKSVILKSAGRMLEKNLDSAAREQIADRVDQLNQHYVTVRDGDQSSLTFKPGSGTTLAVNGEDQVTIEGDDFARLYFSIWFGDRPISNDLKEALLGSDL